MAQGAGAATGTQGSATNTTICELPPVESSLPQGSFSRYSACAIVSSARPSSPDHRRAHCFLSRRLSSPKNPAMAAPDVSPVGSSRRLKWSMSRRGTPNRRVSLVWDTLGGLSRSRARRALALDALDALAPDATDATDATDALDALSSAAAGRRSISRRGRRSPASRPTTSRARRALALDVRSTRSTRAQGRTRRAARGARARGGGARGALDQRAAASARRSSSMR